MRVMQGGYAGQYAGNAGWVCRAGIRVMQGGYAEWVMRVMQGGYVLTLGEVLPLQYHF